MNPAADHHPDTSVVLRVGLTGGIASGKSTVDGMLEMFGAHIIDADALVHRLLEPDSRQYAEVVARFGTGIVRDDSTIDRSALAAIVFADPAELAALNAILHPAVTRAETRAATQIEQSGGGIIVTDAALLVETGRYREYDRLVVVACTESLQLSRLLARNPEMSSEQATARMRAQASVSDKVAVADYVIDTSGSLTDTEERTHQVYLWLHEDLNARRNGETLPERPTVSADFLSELP